MNSQQLSELFDRYKSGHLTASDGSKSPILAAAKSAGVGLSREQFDSLAGYVQRYVDRHAKGELDEKGLAFSLESVPKILNSQWGRASNSLDRDGASAGESERIEPPDIDGKSREAVVNHVDESQDKPYQPGFVARSMDKAQMVLDAVGVFDPTPFVDLVNAGISVGRMFTDPKRAGHHLVNAGVSTLAAIPYFGDLGKVVKYGARGVSKSEKTAGILSGVMKGVFGKAGRAEAAAVKTEANAAEAAASGAASVGSSGGAGGGILQSLFGLFGGGSSGGGGGGGSSVPPGASPQNPGSGGSSGVPNVGGFGLASSLAKGMGALGVVVGGAVLGLKTFVSWLQQVDEKGKGVLNSFSHLAQYNGVVAGAYERLQIERMQRDISLGRYMGKPLSGLTSAQSSYENSMQELTQPYRRLGVNIQTVQTKLADYGARFLRSIDVVADQVTKINAFIERYFPGVQSMPTLERTVDNLDKRIRNDFNL